MGIWFSSAISTLVRLNVDTGRLVLVCSTHYNSQPQKLLKLHFDVASKGSDVLKRSGTEGILKVSTGCVYVLHDSALCPRSVSSCCQPLHGWAAVALRCFHFTITALTVDLGSWSRTEIHSLVWSGCRSVTLSCWKSLSSSRLCLPVFVYGDRRVLTRYIIHLVSKATVHFVLLRFEPHTKRSHYCVLGFPQLIPICIVLIWICNPAEQPNCYMSLHKPA